MSNPLYDLKTELHTVDQVIVVALENLTLQMDSYFSTLVKVIEQQDKRIKLLEEALDDKNN